ncbi:MAG: UbiD family decarboxylase domain-containing protein, partial [Anaerolineae bacterium]
MSPIHNLRSYMARLEQAGKLHRITQPVALKHELANVAATLARQGYGAALFEHPGQATWPVFAGAVVDPEMAALALGCDLGEVTTTMGRALDPANGLDPAPVSPDEAAWRANILTGDDVDLHALPIPTHGQHDGGPFITGGVTVSKD